MNNINPIEIQKFDRISSKWWDDQGPFKALHEINPIRLKFILDNLGVKSLQGKKTLDVGCGGGILSEQLAKLNSEVTGIDASQNAIKVATQHALDHHLKIDYFHTTAEQFITSNPFDIVVCMELLEHVDDPVSLIKACARLVKPDGILFFSTLNRNLKSFLMAIVGAEYILGLLPRGTHDYAKFIRPSEFRKMASEAKLDIHSIKGMTYHPLFKEYSLSEDVGVNYLVCCKPLS